jgi:hypothetical protein
MAKEILRGATTRDRRPILSGRISTFQRVKWSYVGKILDTPEVSFGASLGTYRVLAPGLKIRVSVVRFRPWPPFRSSCWIKELRWSHWGPRPISALVSNISVRCSLPTRARRTGTVTFREKRSVTIGSHSCRKRPFAPQMIGCRNLIRKGSLANFIADRL